MRFEIVTDLSPHWTVVNLLDHHTGSELNIIPEAGAILNTFRLRSGNTSINIIDGYADKKSWLENQATYFNSAHLSPFVCRIANSTYTWEGKEYQLRSPAIHGLLSGKPFEVIDELTAADHAELNLKYGYEGNEPGYPFRFDCLVSYRLEEENRLTITTAIHNRSGRHIPIADGWHHYFSLGKPIDKLHLRIKATQRLEYDQDLIPTGEYIDDDRWVDGAAIGNSVLDHGYLVDRSAAQPLCSLSDPDTGLAIHLYPGNTYPFIQVFTPGHRRSIAIEPMSAAPDALNNQIGLITLAPDHTKTFSFSIQVQQPI